MAEGLLRQVMIDAGKADHFVGSAGLHALVGHPPDPVARQLLANRQIDISAHRATQLNSMMIRTADLILAMESGHKIAIEEKEPSARGKIFRLGEWGKFDIPDPYQQNIDAFKHSLTLIERGVSDWAAKL